MGTVLATTRFTQTLQSGVTTWTVPLARPAAAGSKLVLAGFGGAQITAKLGSSSGPAFTLRAQANQFQAVSVHDIDATGGETTVTITLNGPENIAVIVYEVSGLGAFIAASSNGTGASPGQSTDWQAKPAAVTVPSGNAALFAAWAVDVGAAVSPFNTANRFRQMGPVGKLWDQLANQPGVNSEFIAATGIADITAAGRYPATLTAGQYQATTTWNLNTRTVYCVQAAYVDTSGVPTNPAVNPTVAENSLPGTDNNNWFLGTGGTNATIAGYCDKTSYLPGDTVSFKVDSSGNPFRVEVYRLGWYGWDTYGARNVLGNQGGYLPGTVVAQPAPTVDGTLGSTSCGWTTNATWTVPADAAPGVYYVQYRRTDVTTNVATGHFVVRAPSAAGKVAVVVPDLTHQAYNLWGATSNQGTLAAGTWTGRNLYQAGTDANAAQFTHRAYAVSFDRPYGTQSAQPNTYLFDASYAVLQFAEAQGYNLAYLSDVDLDSNPQALTTAALVVMLGHHEYWTGNVYDAFTAAVDAKVHMLVDSSNTGLWHSRFAVADTNRRTMICYKDSGTADLGAGWSGTGYDPVSYTGTWRDARRNAGTVNNTDPRRENALTGQLFRISAPAATAVTVPFAQKGLPIWRNSAAVQALTVGQTYTTPTGVIGDEADLPDGSAGQPDNLVQLSPTAGSWTTGANANGTIYNTSVSGTASFTLYRRRSGALVFNTGSWRGFEGVSRWQRSSFPAAINTDWQNALLAVLYDLGAAPATLQALRPGLDTALTDPATGAPSGGRSGVALAYGLRAPEDGNANLFFA